MLLTKIFNCKIAKVHKSCQLQYFFISCDIQRFTNKMYSVYLKSCQLQEWLQKLSNATVQSKVVTFNCAAKSCNLQLVHKIYHSFDEIMRFFFYLCLLYLVPALSISTNKTAKPFDLIERLLSIVR